MKKFLVLLLFVISACGPKPEPATPTSDPTVPETATPTSDPTVSELLNRVQLTVETIYSVSNTPMNWEEIPSDGLNVTTVNYPMQDVYHIAVDANGHVTMKYLITEVDMPAMPVYSAPLYSVVVLLYKAGENGLGWSGLMLIQEKDGKIYLERSLTAMSNDQVEATTEALENLLELLDKLQNV